MKEAYKSRIVKTVIFVLGICGGVAFLVTKNLTVMTWFTEQSWRYGDLYRAAQVVRFKPADPTGAGIDRKADSIDLGVSSPQSFTNFFFGDSFGFINCGEGSFFKQLENKIGLPFYGIYNNHHPNPFSDPRSFFNTYSPKGTGNATLLFEVSERSIPIYFGSAPPGIATPILVNNKTGMKNVFRQIKHALFEKTEENHEVLFKHGRWTSPIVEMWNSGMFELFGQISDETPAYSLSPPFLFYKEEISSDFPRHFYTQHDSELISQIVIHIVQLRDDLRSRFHCKLIFIPVPNKSTICGHLVTQERYDDFLPKLYAALQDHGVSTVQIFPRFQDSEESLYYPTDTHWKNAGIQIAVDETVKVWRQR